MRGVVQRFAPAFLAATVLACAAPADDDRPNFVVIVVDTLRADRLPEYGHDRPTSGALADFLGEATRFERAYTPASWTRPAVASLLTGLVPARHRSKAEHSKRLPAAVVTLAEALSVRGWATAGFSHNVNISSKNDFDQGFDVFEAYEGGVLAYPDAGFMVDGALRWLAEGRRPFLLYLQPMNPHGPYRVPEARQADLLGRPPVPGFTYQSPGFQQLMLGRTELRSRIEPRMLESLSEQYDTAIRYTLDEISRLLNGLRSSGLYERSWIVVTGDHGEELFDHGGFGHGYTLFEEAVRVPLFVKPPRDEPRRRAIDHPVSLIDIYPTLMVAAVGMPPDDLDGRSLLPLVRPRAEGHEEAAGAERELLLEGDLAKRCRGRGMIAGRFKLLRIETDYEGRTDELLLFDLEEDPGETRNLAPDRPELAAELEARMTELFAEAESRALPVGDEAPVELDRKTLEALGYLD